MALAIAVETSENKKTGRVSATYAAQESCPNSCQFRNNGCYAETGPIGIHTARLNQKAAKTKKNYLDVAIAEAKAIDTLSGTKPLRLHVVGDCKDNVSVSIVSQAANNYFMKQGQPIWTYTHAWDKVKRWRWGLVSVLASVEKISQIAQARKRGYATAIVVDKHPSDKLYIKGGERILPCPNETRGVTCIDCKLCWDDDRLLASKITIGFSAHGAQKGKVIEAIKNTPSLLS